MWCPFCSILFPNALPQLRVRRGRGQSQLIYACAQWLSALLPSIIIKQPPPPKKGAEFNYDENIVPDPAGPVAVAGVGPNHSGDAPAIPVPRAVRPDTDYKRARVALPAVTAAICRSPPAAPLVPAYPRHVSRQALGGISLTEEAHSGLLVFMSSVIISTPYISDFSKIEQM